jgi:DNA-binding transcriptional LysR family regulator
LKPRRWSGNVRSVEGAFARGEAYASDRERSMGFDPASSRRFDLADLRLFSEVVTTGSITAGARKAHLALAAASARIRGMEETLGIPLLQRFRRGVRATPAGIAVAHHARAVLDQLERMRGELDEYAHGLKGLVRLLSNTAALTEFLPDVLGAFLEEHPNVDVEVEDRQSYEIVPAIAQRRADVGVVADAVDLGSLQSFPFRDDRLVVVAPRGHRVTRRRSVAFAEIARDDFVGMGTGGAASALHAHLLQHAERAGRSLRFRVRLDSFDAVCRLVERGVGISVVPETAARRYDRTMRIHVVPLEDAWAVRRLSVVVRNIDELPAHARQLVDALRRATPTGRDGR